MMFNILLHINDIPYNDSPAVEGVSVHVVAFVQWSVFYFMIPTFIQRDLDVRHLLFPRPKKFDGISE